MNRVILRSKEVKVKWPKPEITEGPDQVKATKKSIKGRDCKNMESACPSTNLKELEEGAEEDELDSWTTER